MFAGASDVPGIFPSGLNKIFVINHFGHFLMTNLLLEKMKNQTKTRPLRIINMSSDAHKFLFFMLVFLLPFSTFAILLLLYSFALVFICGGVEIKDTDTECTSSRNFKLDMIALNNK